MASLEKNHKTVGPGKRKSSKKKSSAVPDIETPERHEVGLKPSTQTNGGSVPGSVISVQNADDNTKTENLQNGESSTENPSEPPQTENTKPEVVPKVSPDLSPDHSSPSNPVSRVPSAVSRTKADLAGDQARPSSANSRNGNLDVAPQKDTMGSAVNLKSPSVVSLKSMGKKNQVEPVNTPGSNMGSAVSLQSRASREAWNVEGGSIQRPISATSKTTAKSQSRPGSAANSVISVNEANSRNRIGDDVTKGDKAIEIIPADMNEAHAYVPYLYARDCISKMMDDMKKMKRKHITIINDIEENYQHIETETQGQFNTFVIGLRQQYGNKVKTFRQVIEVHRTELGNKENYWDEALTSLSNKNKQLLQDKKALLIQNKIDSEKAEKTKEDELKDLVAQVDERNKAFITFEKDKNEEVHSKLEKGDKEKQETVSKVEEERDNMKKECEEEVEKLKNENKILNDELENEKGEKIRLQAVLDDLKTRPETAAAVTTAIAFKRAQTPVDRKTEESVQSAAVVSDMSDDERKKMEQEREEMKRERNRMEKERDDFIEERKHFQEERIVIQGDLNNAQKDKAVWKAKYDGLKGSLGEYDDWKKRYEILLAQYQAVTAVAVVNTEEEKSNTEKAIQKADKDKVIMEEETQKLDDDIKQWENNFKKQNRRAPTESDRNDSAAEMYKSKEETDHMVNKLKAQIVALEALKRGEIPAVPEPEKETIVINEKEVTTVEIKIPDPELLAYVEMTQAELEAMKKQLTALKNDKTDLRSELAKLEDTNKDLENKLRQSRLQGEPASLPSPKPQLVTKDASCQTDPLPDPPKPVVTASEPVPVKSEPAPVPVVDHTAIEELEKQLREKDKEIREIELAQKDAMRELEKEKDGLEKDLKKALKALDKAMKSGTTSKEDKKLKNLLAIVVAQVREINKEVNKAAIDVDKRLKSAENSEKKSAEAKNKATEQYKEWELGWAEENGKNPVLEDVEGDKPAFKLYKIMKAANKKANEDDLLLEALTLIKTGALPEPKVEKEVSENQQSPVLAAALTPDKVEPCNHEEEIERLENTVSDLEKKIGELEDQVRDLEKQKDILTNENKDLEDRIADLLAEIEKLRRQVEFHKQKEQELHKQMEEDRLQHAQELRDQEREHQRAMEEKEEEYRKEKQEMESDIKKLVKLIDKLKKKMAKKAKDAEAPRNELEQLLEEKDDELDELDEAINELEDKNHDLENDKKHLKEANRKLEEKISDLETTITKTETTVTELGGASIAATASEAENKQLRDDLEALRKKIKELEQDVRVKNKELREMEYEHEKDMRDKEREVKEMKNDIEKLVKLLDKLRKQVKEDKKNIASLEKEASDLLKECHEKDEEIDDLIGKLNEGEKEVKRLERSKPKREKEEDFEEVITELKTKVTFLEDNVEKNEVKAHDYEADFNMMKAANKELEDEVDELQEELTNAQNRIADLEALAGASEMLDKAQDELSNMRRKLKATETDLREKEKDAKDKEITMKEQKNEFDRKVREKELEEREMKSDIKKLLKQIDRLQKQLKTREDLLTEEGRGPDLAALSEKDEEVAQMESALEKLEDKAQELEYKVADLQTENKHVQKDLDSAIKEKKKLEAKIQELKDELDRERDKAPVETNFSPMVPMAASTPTTTNLDLDLEDLTSQIEKLQKQVDRTEAEVRQEKSDHEATKDELAALKQQLSTLKVESENQKHEAVAQLEGMKEKKETEIDNLKKKLSEMRKRNEELEHQQLKSLPADAAKEIKQMKALVIASEKELDNKEVEKADLSSKVRELIAKVKSLENSSKNQKTHGSDAEIKLKNLRQEKDREIKHVQVQAEKKEIERALQEKKKISALEQKIRLLESGAPRASGKEKVVEGKADPKALKDIQDKLKEAKRENADLNTRVKQLEKAASKPAGAGEAELKLKKQEKLSQELMKKMDDVQKKNKKNEENLRKQDEDINDLQKNNSSKDKEIEKLKAELSSLGVAAKAGIESEQRRKELDKEVKDLHHENKIISDNWNQERVLRKKYYNIVEDMKGKIRVYARVRPISKSELDRGNVTVTKSPDEYTIQVQTQRGHKEWQFDQVFMPETSQEKVFDDTNNLIQSAVDGYNVCIFAYGQTGSGKTFTIIGDRGQQFPGIAPRAFNRVFELLNENKAKFKFSVSCYMLELYNDKLLDLLGKPGHGSDDKLDIKKDKKGMVHVQGAEIKEARNAKELFAIFEEGSVNRHTASTQMNAESSRSHLVISVILETTNRATGQIVKGKLSLVDLAGSERAAKTNAGAEQLKEAMSINKSLSALGDVISALSSEQSFIPYRNNKLTMLMQDSLGGNAKTLMFVNVSPVDYNADETAISLTYASRVKLITNDAQKNSDNKEIARLKAVVAKFKIGTKLTEEEEKIADDAQQQLF